MYDAPFKRFKSRIILVGKPLIEFQYYSSIGVFVWSQPVQIGIVQSTLMTNNKKVYELRWYLFFFLLLKFASTLVVIFWTF